MLRAVGERTQDPDRQPGAGNARCISPACRSPTRPATGCATGWVSAARNSTTPTLFAIMPMGFCFPGQDAKGADLPPRRECAPAWRAPLMAAMPQIELVLTIGLYAQAWHLGAALRGSLTEHVRDWRAIYAADADAARAAAAAPVVAQHRLAEAAIHGLKRICCLSSGRKFATGSEACLRKDVTLKSPAGEFRSCSWRAKSRQNDEIFLPEF